MYMTKTSLHILQDVFNEFPVFATLTWYDYYLLGSWLKSR